MKKIINSFLLCLIFIASSGTESAEPQRGVEPHSKKLTLIGEAHSSPEGMRYCYGMMRDKPPASKLNFFIERDDQRMQWARVESGLLKYDSEDEFLKNHRFHLSSVETLPDGLAGRIYGNIFTALKSEQPGLLKNRFWFLKILRDFSNDPNIKIVPIDASFTEVISHESFTSKSAEFDAKFAADLTAARETRNQTYIDIIMKSDWALEPRNLIMTHKLEERTEVGSINIALLGLVHAAEVFEYLHTQLEISPRKTNIPEGELAKEKENARVQGFLSKAALVN